MNTTADQHDPYALYVRAYRNYGMTWVGPDPIDAVAQLAISLGKKDSGVSGTGLKTRIQLDVEIIRYNASAVHSHSRPMPSRLRARRVRGRITHWV